MGRGMRRRGKAKFRRPQPGRKKPQGKSGPDPQRESRVRLLPVDPYLVHAYWELVDEDLETLRSQLGSGGAEAKPVLRFYDITYILFDGNNAHGFFDVEIDLGARNWYVHLWSPEKSYCADLGLKTPEGRFLPLLRSNVAQTPPAWPAIREEERYMHVGPENRVEKMGEEQILTGEAQGKTKTRGEPGRPEETGASPGENELNPAVPSPGRGVRTFDLTQLSEQHFSGGISSWPSRAEGE